MAKGYKYTQQTLERIRDLGWTYYKAEHWQKTTPPKGYRIKDDGGRSGVRIDAFGFGDIDAIRKAPDGFPFPRQSLLIQSTSKGCMSARRKKILTECRDKAKAVLESGRAIEIWGWYKTSYLLKSGKQSTAKRWDVKIQEITLADFAQEELHAL